jgi:hypothetical protein
MGLRGAADVYSDCGDEVWDFGGDFDVVFPVAEAIFVIGAGGGGDQGICGVGPEQ